jgi:hypothetical protein
VLETLGDLVTVEVFLRLGQDGQEDEPDQPGIQFPLEFQRQAFLGRRRPGAGSSPVSGSTEDYLLNSIVDCIVLLSDQ